MADLKPRRLGDGFLFLLVFSAILILFLSVGLAVESNLTEPVSVSGEQHYHNASNSSEVIQLDHVYTGCVEDSVKAWDPVNQSYLEEGLEYRVLSYDTCSVNVSNYESGDILFSYSSKRVDGEAVSGVSVMTSVARIFIYGLMPIAFIVIFILFSPRIIKAMQRGNTA